MQHPPGRRSTGDLISTLCFAGTGLWLAGESLAAGGPRAVLIGLCALACLLAAARHRIAALLRGRDR